MILVDTSVFGRIAEETKPLSAPAYRALKKLLSGNDSVIVVPQVLYEFWVVATRPVASNGLGLSSSAAHQWTRYICRTCKLMKEPADLYDFWLQIVTTQGVSGRVAHDARLVAAMHALGAKQILTFNVADFRRFGADVIDPSTM